MGAAPEWKVYRDKEYVAAFKYAEDAAMLVACAGGEIRHGHNLVVWREGAEEFPAGESYDRAARIMKHRRHTRFVQAYDKLHGEGAAARLLNQG
jgi:hypothetical protein